MAMESVLVEADTTSVTLYEGQKNFWRARQNVDLRIVEHTVAKVIEVIAYSADLHAESPRVYIESKRLYSKLDSSEIDEKINAKREELARARKRAPLDEMKQAIVQEMTVAYILARLQIVSVETDPSILEEPLVEETEATTAVDGTAGTEGGAAAASGDGHVTSDPAQSAPDHGFRVKMLPVSGDSAHNGKLDMVLAKKPAGITDIVIPRRKKTTMQDFHKEMRAFRADTAQLNHANAHASRKAGLAVQSTDAFKGMLRSRSSLDDSHLSIAQKRWIWAGRKVMLQNYVAAVHRRLERYSLSSIPSESITKQGQELKDKLNALSAGRGLRASQSALKLPSLGDCSKDARRGSRSSRDAASRRSFTREREMEDFSKSFSLNVHARVEARLSGQVEPRKSLDGKPGGSLPAIGAQ